MLEGHTHSVLSVTFNGHNLLASGSKDRTIRIWNTDIWVLVKELEDHKRDVNSVCFNQNSVLASGAWDNTIRIWKP